MAAMRDKGMDTSHKQMVPEIEPEKDEEMMACQEIMETCLEEK
jgi:hypothetical protein